MMGAYGKIANGNIKPMRFVKLDTTAPDRVVVAGAGDRIYGISGPGTRRMALSGWDDGYHAIAGEMCEIYGPGDPEVQLVLGGTVTAGDYIKSDADGAGVVADTNLDDYGARTTISGVATEQIKVEVMIGERSTS